MSSYEATTVFTIPPRRPSMRPRVKQEAKPSGARQPNNDDKMQEMQRQFEDIQTRLDALLSFIKNDVLAPFDRATES